MESKEAWRLVVELFACKAFQIADVFRNGLNFEPTYLWICFCSLFIYCMTYHTSDVQIWAFILDKYIPDSCNQLSEFSSHEVHHVLQFLNHCLSELILQLWPLALLLDPCSSVSGHSFIEMIVQVQNFKIRFYKEVVKWIVVYRFCVGGFSCWNNKYWILNMWMMFNSELKITFHTRVLSLINLWKVGSQKLASIKMPFLI